MTTYPNREHENADKAARRRALAALDHLSAEAATLRKRLTDEAGVDGDDSQRIAALARDLTQHLAILGILQEVREWRAADIAEAGARLLATHQGHLIDARHNIPAGEQQ